MRIDGMSCFRQMGWEVRQFTGVHGKGHFARPLARILRHVQLGHFDFLDSSLLRRQRSSDQGNQAYWRASGSETGDVRLLIRVFPLLCRVKLPSREER